MSKRPQSGTGGRLPSDEPAGLGIFDRFATWVSTHVARAPFFTICVLLVLVWAPTLLFLDLDTSQLLINTATTIITFLLVSLSANSAARADRATQLKQNAMVDALADLCEEMADQLGIPRLTHHAAELRQAVGLEERVSS